MKLAAKLVALIVLGIVLRRVFEGYLSVQREVELFDTDMRRDALLLGDAMKRPIADVWRSSGQDRAIQLIEDANAAGHPVQIRWVWLDVPAGDPSAPLAPRDQLEPVLSGEEVCVKVGEDQGHGQLCTYVPVEIDDSRPGALELSESLELASTYTRTTAMRAVISTVGMVALSGLVVVVLGFWFVGRPLRLLAEKARRVGSGDLSEPVQIVGHDELAELGRHINAMCEHLAEAQARVQAETEGRIAALEQSRHADRLQTVGRLASGVAHELGTPLNVVSGRAGLIAKGDLSEAEIVESAQIIRSESERMTALIRQLLDFARLRSPRKESADLRKLAGGVLDLLKPLASKRGINLILVGNESPVTVPVDVRQIQQVLTNIMINAIQAMPSGGTVQVGITRLSARPPDGEDAAEREYVRVDVQDEGEGIALDDVTHVFEPFFTTKDVGEGTGLGLSIGYGIVKEHGGWIDVHSEPGRGSCFSVYVPQETTACPDAS